ncbi:unnamed protein product, partial [Cladocopium goreaui]
GEELVAPGPIVGADGPTEPEGQRLQKQQSARKRATGQQSPRELLKEELVDRRGSEKVYELRIAPRRSFWWFRSNTSGRFKTERPSFNRASATGSNYRQRSAAAQKAVAQARARGTYAAAISSTSIRILSCSKVSSKSKGTEKIPSGTETSTTKTPGASERSQETEPKAKGPPPTPKAQEPKAAGPTPKAGERIYHIGRNVTLLNPNTEQLEEPNGSLSRRKALEEGVERPKTKREPSRKKRKTKAAPEPKAAEAKPRPKSQQVLKRPAAAVSSVEPKAKPKKEHPSDSEYTYTDTYVWESEEEEEAAEQDAVEDYFCESEELVAGCANLAAGEEEDAEYEAGDEPENEEVVGEEVELEEMAQSVRIRAPTDPTPEEGVQMETGALMKQKKVFKTLIKPLVLDTYELRGVTINEEDKLEANGQRPEQTKSLKCRCKSDGDSACTIHVEEAARGRRSLKLPGLLSAKQEYKGVQMETGALMKQKKVFKTLIKPLVLDTYELRGVTINEEDKLEANGQRPEQTKSLKCRCKSDGDSACTIHVEEAARGR